MYLHMHTTASDGAWTRSELLDLLAKYDITTFAVTDHDTTQNSAEGRSAWYALYPRR